MEEFLLQFPWFTPVMYGGLSIGFLFSVIRIARGPDLVDRVIALDLAMAIVLCFAAVYAVVTGHSHFLDVALVIAVIAFVGTVALARYLEKGVNEEEEP